MKSGKGGNLFLFFALAILISSPFVFAGFASWWEGFTGKATSATASVSISVGNTAPNVYSVNVTFPVSGTGTVGGGTLYWHVMFNVSDADGSENVNPNETKLQAHFNLADWERTANHLSPRFTKTSIQTHLPQCHCPGPRQHFLTP